MQILSDNTFHGGCVTALLKAGKVLLHFLARAKNALKVVDESVACRSRNTFRRYLGTETELLAFGKILPQKEDQDLRTVEDFVSMYRLD